MTALVQAQAATRLQVTVPMRGPMLVQAAAPDDVTPVSGQVAFTIGDLTLNAALVPDRFGMFAGSWSGMAVGGFGGWKQAVDRKGYTSPQGLLLEQILSDVALTVGEAPPVLQDPTAVVGGFYMRRAGLASQVFGLLPAGTDWWIDASGVTQVGTRAPGIVTSEFEFLGFDRDRGRLFIATDSPSAFVPAKTVVTVEGSFVINSAIWTADTGALRGELWIA